MTRLDEALQRVEGEPWRDRAVCRSPGFDPEWWFPHPSQPGLAEAAKRLCRSCPVSVQCQAKALAVEARHGIWGGIDMTVVWELIEKGAAQ